MTCLIKSCWVVGLTLLLDLSPARAQPASVASIEPEELVEYEDQPRRVRELIDYALSLTKQDLSYKYGSNSPRKMGMDCSGTVQHTLAEIGVKGVPRSSYAMFHWAEENGAVTSTAGAASTGDSVFGSLRPGDLVFWEGTYDTGDRDPPISHVMIYLGKLKKDGKGIVFGASSGRRYRGKRIHGVSVFDWRAPSVGSKSKLVGFGAVPGLRPPKDG
ncbi:MAG: NlpC/P60 family protein [Verrucomicrobiales bacterium]